MRKNNGITLIALAITVIVLIIIASVTTYSGASALRDAKEEKQIAELGMIRQPVVENYTKYLTTKDEKYIRGEKVDDADMQKLINEINNESNEKITLKATTGTTDITDYYYRLSNDDLKEMEVTQAEDTYIVNYKTGEIINETLKATRTGKPLYTFSNSSEESNESQIVLTPNKQDSYVTSLDITITAPAEFTGLKYKWTNILKEPATDEFTESVPSTNIITTPTGVKGNFYLWIYAQDAKGNEIITYSGGYMINNL